MALPLFAITLFVSAFLLFLVQPMIGKMILPKLGGTPQVWNTCMMFFQTALLAGYAYTHSVSTKLGLKRQLIVHGVLLIVPVIVLLLFQSSPFSIASFDPPPEDNPIPATLLLLAIVVGLPFFVVSTSAPLLQKWFSNTGHPAAKDPYFLYGASNLGSLLSLILYPFLVEPLFVLQTQAWIWTVGYILLAGLIAASAYLVWQAPPSMQLAGVPTDAAPASEAALIAPPIAPPVAQTNTAIQPASAQRGVSRKKGVKLPGAAVEKAPTPSIAVQRRVSDDMTWGRRIRWIMLAAVPSSLMLGVTSYASIDLSPFPLLWVIPLALYLLSFILVFSKWPAVWTEGPHTIMLLIMPLAILAMCLIILVRGHYPSHAIFSFIGFFFVACALHGELALDRPSPRHLTEYFLLMSVGGMIGGVFNGLFAPVIFTGVVEYPLAIILACIMRPRSMESGWTDNLVLKSSPDLEGWLQDTGDKLAVSFGGQPRRSTYLLHYTFDVLLALLVFGIAWYLKDMAVENSWHKQNTKSGIYKLTKFLGFDVRTTFRWHDSFFNGIVYGVPIVIAWFFAGRPWRFGLAVGGILLANLYFLDRERGVLAAERSYFGVLRVNQAMDGVNQTKDGLPVPPLKGGHVEADFILPGEDGRLRAPYTSLTHGTTLHGRNYFVPPSLSRLATTYYHRWGPIGIVMERYNWAKGPQNTYWADARLPAGMFGLAATPLGVGNLPLDQLCHVWSEPPFATIGLGSGTMASYGRVYQHVVYYEIDEKIRNYSLPLDNRLTMPFEGGRAPFFKYLKQAQERGSNLEVIMGDARLSMENSQKKGTPRPGSLFTIDGDRITQNKDHHLFPKRDNYYRVIVVDAFSSDAIPVHLITREAIELYMSQLHDEGVLCVHTSNRHLALVEPVSDIAKELKLFAVVGHDGDRNQDPDRPEPDSLGHTGSEYVMLSRSKSRLAIKNLEKVRLDPSKKDDNPATNPVVSMDADKSYGGQKQWYIPTPPERRIWTDDYTNIISILR